MHAIVSSQVFIQPRTLTIKILRSMSRCAATLLVSAIYEVMSHWHFGKGKANFHLAQVKSGQQRGFPTSPTSHHRHSKSLPPSSRFIFVVPGLQHEAGLVTARLTTRQDVFAILFVTRIRAKKWMQALPRWYRLYGATWRCYWDELLSSPERDIGPWEALQDCSPPVMWIWRCRCQLARRNKLPFSASEAGTAHKGWASQRWSVTTSASIGNSNLPKPNPATEQHLILAQTSILDSSADQTLS